MFVDGGWCRWPYKASYTASLALIRRLTRAIEPIYRVKNSPYNNVGRHNTIASPGSILWAWMQSIWAGGTRENQ
jgi:hypothetical protein